MLKGAVVAFINYDIYIRGIEVEWLRKTSENFSQDNQYPGRVLTRTIPKEKYSDTVTLTCLVLLICLIIFVHISRVVCCGNILRYDVIMAINMNIAV